MKRILVEHMTLKKYNQFSEGGEQSANNSKIIRHGQKY